jgi:hypothetical protein
MPKKSDTDNFLDKVHACAAEWQRLGWLVKWTDENGEEMWELTPAGRRARGLPPIPSSREH